MSFFVWVRAILAGWAVLWGLAYGVEGPLLHCLVPLFRASWIATVQLAVDSSVFAAAGWVVGRLNRARAIRTAGLFIVTLSFWNFDEALGLNVPWLLKLVWNSLHDSRYLDATLATAETHALLFGCLIAGSALSRPREKPVSIANSI